MDIYKLPERVTLEGEEYGLHTDFREVLEILRTLEDRSLPESLRWRVAVGIFYDKPVSRKALPGAMAYLAEFLCCGQPENPGPKLLDWQQDAPHIIAGVNAAAGCEVRSLPKVHWWTFLSWFHAMPAGTLSTVVGIREKLRKGKPLEDWEKDFYRAHRGQVDLKTSLTEQEETQKMRLNRLLGD